MSWAYGAFTELFDETGLDLFMHRSTVRGVYGPFFVTQNLAGFNYKCPGTCLLFIAVVEDAQLQVVDGALTYGGTPIWSREVARHAGHELPYAYASQQVSSCKSIAAQRVIRAGQFWAGRRIFHLVELCGLEASEWRSIDWITLALMRKELEEIVLQHEHWRGSAWTLFHFASAREQFVENMEATLRLAQLHCRLPHLPWPLTSSLAYNAQSKPWRARKLRSRMRKLRSRMRKLCGRCNGRTARFGKMRAYRRTLAIAKLKNLAKLERLLTFG